MHKLIQLAIEKTGAARTAKKNCSKIALSYLNHWFWHQQRECDWLRNTRISQSSKIGGATKEAVQRDSAEEESEGEQYVAGFR